MSKNELADYLESKNFPEEFRLYLERLRNTRSYDAWFSFLDGNTALVQVTMADNGKLSVTSYTPEEVELKVAYDACMEGLASAQQTIDEQNEKIKALEAEATAAAAPKVTKRKRDLEAENED